jgi:hypothetical protein
MELVEFWGWRFHSDAEATRRAYERLQMTPSEISTSVYARNFDAARDRAYPDETRELFERLGIDYRYFGELWIPDNAGSGLYHYHGVFHFSGVIDVTSVGNDPIRLISRFCMTFSTGDYAPGPVASDLLKQGLPVVQIDFETVVPWVIEEPEPENLPLMPPDYDCQSLRPRRIHVK